MTNSSHTAAVEAPENSLGQERGHKVVEGLGFADVPRLELDQLLAQLLDRADDVLATQGRLRGLLRANAAVASDLSLPSLLRHIVDAARDLLHARYAAIVVLGCDGRLEQLVHAGIDEDLATRLSRLHHGRDVLDLLTEYPDMNPPRPAEASGSGAPGRPSIGDFLGVPLRVGEEVFGNLYLRSSPGKPFSVDDEQLVTALAATAGVAIPIPACSMSPNDAAPGCTRPANSPPAAGVGHRGTPEVRHASRDGSGGR